MADDVTVVVDDDINDDNVSRNDDNDGIDDGYDDSIDDDTNYNNDNCDVNDKGDCPTGKHIYGGNDNDGDDDILGRGTWWRFGRVEAFRPEGLGFESRSSSHVGTLGKFFTRRFLCRFGMKLLHSIRAMSGALLSSS